MLTISYGTSNPGITCAPACLSSVSASTIPSSVCRSNQDIGLCGLIAATNVISIAGYSQWVCTTAGTTVTSPCQGTIWNGVTCFGSNVVAISLDNIGLSGKYWYIVCIIDSLLIHFRICCVYIDQYYARNYKVFPYYTDKFNRYRFWWK